MDFKKLIDNKNKSARYMVEEITYICKNLGKRNPGSEGERKACEYMAGVLKDCGCERVAVESFSEHPASFYGWLYLTITFILAAVVFLFFKPLVSVCLIALGLAIAILQFGLYFKAVDFLFPKKTGHNVSAFKECTGETQRRIIFNGHPDAAWEWPVNYMLGGVGFESHAIISFAGAFYYLVLAIIQLCSGGAGVQTGTTMGKCALWGLVFVPFLIGMYFMNNERRVVDGANDNLSGCYMGIAILKAMQEEGMTLEHTEIGVVLSGSEEAGLRGAKAWCEAHQHEFDDVPTFIFSYDTIHDPKHLMVNYKDLNGTVKADKDASDLFMEAAEELGVQCRKGMVPLLGGSTDSAAFNKAGFRAAGITGLNHKLESYYHTRRDSYDNMNEAGLADCYAASVKVLELFDKGAKQ